MWQTETTHNTLPLLLLETELCWAVVGVHYNSETTRTGWLWTWARISLVSNSTTTDPTMALVRLVGYVVSGRNSVLYLHVE